MIKKLLNREYTPKDVFYMCVIYIMLGVAIAWAADSKLSALVELAATPAASDEFYVNDGGTSKKIQYSNLIDEDAIAGAISEGALTDASVVDADIKDDTIQEPALNSTNAPTDNYVLSYNAAGTNFTWIEASGSVSVSDDESTDDDHEVVFTTDNSALESDGDFTYNPSTGAVSATSFQSAANASPKISFDDSNSASETEDAKIAVNATDTDDTEEDVDMEFHVQIDSTLTKWLSFEADPSGAGADPLINVYYEMKIADGKAIRFDEAAADPNDADVKMVGADGKWTLSAVNGANNEDISIDLDATSNRAEVTSSTGVTDLDLNSINLVSTGTILGAINIVTTTDGSESPTAEQMYGTMFIADHATAANDTDYTLPTAAAGMAACFYDNGGGAGGIIIDAAAGDEILLDGTGIGAAEAIDSPGVAGDGANGDFICLLAIDATYWITMGASGTWVDGGAD